MCHLTWSEGHCPKLNYLAETGKIISDLIEEFVLVDGIKSHQCSLFSRSLLGVLAASFPEYKLQAPESSGLLNYVYSWLNLYRSTSEVLTMTRKGFHSLREHPS